LLNKLITKLNATLLVCAMVAGIASASTFDIFVDLYTVTFSV